MISTGSRVFRRACWRRIAIAAISLAAPAAADAQLVEPGVYGEDAGAALTRQLKILADEPRSVSALIGAGSAALELGDPQAALTFFARAEEISPQDGRVKAGMGSALVSMEDPQSALRYFQEAAALGVPVAEFAGSRGLAYDLLGDPRRAQTDYNLALRRQDDPEIRRRLALSLANSGEREKGLAVISDQLLRRDRAAWRTRAFILALGGDSAGATRAMEAVMPGQSAQMQPFFARLPSLTPAQRAMAVNFGEMPGGARGSGGAPPSSYASASVPTRAPAQASRPLPETRIAGPTPAPSATATAGSRTILQRRNPQASEPARPSLAERASGSQTRLASAEPKPAPKAAAPAAAASGPEISRPAPAASGSLSRLAPSDSDPERKQSPQPAQRATARPQSNAPTSPPVASTSPRAASTRPFGPVDSRPIAGLQARPAAPPSNSSSVGKSPSSNPAASPASPAPAPSVGSQLAQSFAPPPPSQTAPSQAQTPPPQVETPPPQVQRAPRLQPIDLPPSAVTGNVSIVPPASAGEQTSAPASPKASTAPPEPVQPAPAAPSPKVRSFAEVAAAIEALPDELSLKPKPAAPKQLSLKTEPKTAPAASASRHVGRTDATTAPKPPKPAASKAKTQTEADEAEAGAAGVSKAAAGGKGEAKAKAKADAKPASRSWVQIAHGAMATLSREFSRIKAKAPKLLSGRAAWTAPMKGSSRLLVGPFKSGNEAQGFVNQLAKADVEAFSWTSPAGEEIVKLPAK